MKDKSTIGIRYPLDTPPEHGTATEIADGMRSLAPGLVDLIVGFNWPGYQAN